MIAITLLTRSIIDYLMIVLHGKQTPIVGMLQDIAIRYLKLFKLPS